MKVSVLTPSLNQGAFLDEAIASLADQSGEVEHIVVDGGSADDTRAVLDRHRDRLAAVVVEPDEGPAQALNKALALATGELVLVLNADDALLPGAVEQAVQAAAADRNVAVVYGHGYVADAGGRLVRRFRSTPFDPRRFVLGGVTVMHQATFVRREALLAIGGWNERNRTCWDGEALVRLALTGERMRLVEAYWGTFRLHPGSISGSQRYAAEYDADRARLFELVMGRAPGRGDGARAVAARAAKWARDPGALAVRLAEAAGVRP